MLWLSGITFKYNTFNSHIYRTLYHNRNNKYSFTINPDYNYTLHHNGNNNNSNAINSDYNNHTFSPNWNNYPYTYTYTLPKRT